MYKVFIFTLLMVFNISTNFIFLIILFKVINIKYNVLTLITYLTIYFVNNFFIFLTFNFIFFKFNINLHILKNFYFSYFKLHSFLILIIYTYFFIIFLEKKKLNFKFSNNNNLYTGFFIIILGMLWAYTQKSWGYFWSNDNIEFILLFFLVSNVYLLHKHFFENFFYKFILSYLVLSIYIFTKTNYFISKHNYLSITKKLFINYSFFFFTLLFYGIKIKQFFKNNFTTIYIYTYTFYILNSLVYYNSLKIAFFICIKIFFLYLFIKLFFKLTLIPGHFLLILILFFLKKNYQTIFLLNNLTVLYIDIKDSLFKKYYLSNFFLLQIKTFTFYHNK